MQRPALIRPLPPAARLCLLWLLAVAALALPLSIRAEAPTLAADATLADGALERLALAPWTLSIPEPAGAKGPHDLPPLSSWESARPGSDIKLGGFLGFDSRPHWLRVELRNDSYQVLQRVLVLHHPGTSMLRVIGEVPGSAPREFLTGATLPASTRALDSRHFAFPVKLAPRSTQVWWLRVESQRSMTLPLYLWEPNAFEHREAQDLLFYGAAFGGLVALLLYNAILLFALRQKSYFHYSLYCLLALCASVEVTGYHLVLGNALFAPINDGLDGFFLAMTGAALVHFLIGLFDLAKTLPRHLKVLRGIQFFWLMAAPCFFWKTALVANIVTVPSSLALGYIYFVVANAVRQGLPGARALLLGLTVLFSGATVLLQFYAGNVAWSPLVAFAYPLGTALEMVLAALSLAAVINKTRDDAAKARLALETEKVALLRQSEQELEQRVGERTSFLHTVLKELVDAKEAAEAASVTKDQLMANMSHELRTPINSITGTTFLLGQSGLSDQQRTYVDRIQRAAENLLRLINRVLDLSALSEHRAALTRLEFSLRELVKKLALGAQKQAAARNLEFRMTVDEALPDSLLGDAERLYQLLDNYLDNAFKFTEGGAVTVNLALQAEDSEGIVLHGEVADTGIGLDAEQQLQLFQPLHQADGSRTRAYGGLGLGLALNREIAALMQGEVGVRSAPGAGSTFWFTVRVARGRRAIAEELAAADTGPTPGLGLLPAGSSRDLAASSPETRAAIAQDPKALIATLAGLLEEGDVEAAKLINANFAVLSAALGATAAGELAKAAADWDFDTAAEVLRAALATRPA